MNRLNDPVKIIASNDKTTIMSAIKKYVLALGGC